MPNRPNGSALQQHAEQKRHAKEEEIERKPDAAEQMELDRTAAKKTANGTHIADAVARIGPWQNDKQHATEDPVSPSSDQARLRRVEFLRKELAEDAPLLSAEKFIAARSLSRGSLEDNVASPPPSLCYLPGRKSTLEGEELDSMADVDSDADMSDFIDGIESGTSDEDVEMPEPALPTTDTCVPAPAPQHKVTCPTERKKLLLRRNRLSKSNWM